MGTQRTGTGISAQYADQNNNAPVLSIDIANKAYVDAVAQGLSPKTSGLLATAAALPAYTYANGVLGVGATITEVGVGALLIDGVTPAVNDRVLIKNETAGNAPYNGIYVVTQVGSGILPFILTRALDNNQAAEFPGSYIFIESGTDNTGAGFVCTNVAPVVVGTTAIVWTQFSGAGEITVVAPLVKSGNQLSISNITDASIAAANKDGTTGTPSMRTLGTGAAQAAQGSAVLLKDGSVPLTGDMSMGSHKLTSVTDPASAQDAATKNYVDTVVAAVQSTAGIFWYGSGVDGALSLAGDTVLAANACIKQYSSITLNGFTLSSDTSQSYTLLYCSGTCAFGTNGVICEFLASTTGAGGTAATGDSNAGGAGGGFRFAIFLYAKTITGTGTVTCAGSNGGNGANSVTCTVASNGGAGGAGTSTNLVRMLGVVASGGTPAAGAGGTRTATPPNSAAAGAAGTLTISATAASHRSDLLQLLFRNDTSALNSGGAPRCWNGSGAAGGGGGSGNIAGASNACAGGGGGGGAAGLGGSVGGAGGASGNTANATNENAGGGGGGGGGGSGGLALVWTHSAPSTLTVSAKGGDGGNGGNARGAAGGHSGGGGGGSGGGGVSVLIAQSGNTATNTANGGTAGTGGNGVNAGAAGAAGGTGGNGVAMTMVSV